MQSVSPGWLARWASGGPAARQLLPVDQYIDQHDLQVPDEHDEPGQRLGGRSPSHNHDPSNGWARNESSEFNVFWIILNSGFLDETLEDEFTTIEEDNEL